MVKRRQAMAVIVAAAALLAGCTDPVPGSVDAEVTIGLTYIPNVQFAPFYVAAEAGYFAEEGVRVQLRHHGQDEDLFGALEAGTEDLVVAGGDEMMQARAQGSDVVSIGTLYQQYPVVLIVPEGSAIAAPADLAGRTVGIPGPFGETYFGLLAMLDGAGLTTEDVTVQSIGYTQVSALADGHVDAVMGFVNNDVPQMNSVELPVTPIPIGEVPLVGIGVGASSSMIDDSPAALQAVMAAVDQAIADIVADPQVAIDAARSYIPGSITAADEAAMMATLQATLPLYGNPPYLEQDPALWAQMSAFLRAAEIVTVTVPADEAFTAEFSG